MSDYCLLRTNWWSRYDMYLLFRKMKTDGTWYKREILHKFGDAGTSPV